MEKLIEAITVETAVNVTIETAWKLWTTPADIAVWNSPSADWHAPKAENNLRTGGSFFYRMESKDGTEGFDHFGTYDHVTEHQLIEYTVSDGRKSVIKFLPDGNTTTIIETFEPERQTPHDLQKDFCQGVLNNFKKYAENVS
jgi:uncharacterized protein YndB with AHSA1/START domain